MTKKKRFEIFERDNFTCQYCGKTPPEAILHVDHIHPKSKGGEDDELNLITSCRDCNLGKKAKILKNSKRNVDVKEKLEDLKETERQIKEYYNYLKKIKSLKEENPIIDLLCETWEEESCDSSTLNNAGRKSLQSLLNKGNTAEDIIKAIKISWENSRIEVDEKWKYTCGVLKNLKMERDNPELAKQTKEEKSIFYRLINIWKYQPQGSGYLPEWKVKEWLKDYTENEIKEAMDNANGIWSELKNQLE